MKKLLSFFAASIIVGSSSTNVISCSARHVTEITLISDMGKVNDESFNQSGYEGGNDFMKNVLEKNTKISAIEPKDSTELRIAYSKAISKGATDLILPGFTHQSYIDAVQNIFESDDPNGTAVFLDGSTNGNQNVIGLKYKCDISGFLGGLSAAILFAIKNKDKTEEVKCTMATYGGIANKVAVTCYMTGFLASINAFNILKANGDLEVFGITKDNKVTATRAASQSEDISTDDDKKFFTNSFGTGDGKTISQTLINTDKANVIMAVAGPQTGDTLGILNDENISPDQTMVVGVDTDQVNGYPLYKKYFATSALKVLKGSTEVALAHTNDYKDLVSQEKLTKIEDDNGVSASDIKFVKTSKSSDGQEQTEVVTDTNAKTSLENSGSSWDGYEVWFNGDIAHGGDNQLTDSQYQILREMFLSKDSKYKIISASDSFFKDCEKSTFTNADCVNKARVAQWVEDAGIK